MTYNVSGGTLNRTQSINVVSQLDELCAYNVPKCTVETTNSWLVDAAVSYTHLTLPTIYSV